MAKRTRVWYDPEGDYLEVLFERKKGYFRETKNDAVMKKIDGGGNVIGFSILKISALKKKSPISVRPLFRPLRMTDSVYRCKIN